MHDAPPKGETSEDAASAEPFDYAEPAELFTRAGMIAPAGDGSQPGAPRGQRRKGITYRRFADAAEAIRFAIEELPAEHLLATVLVVNGERHEGLAIRELYASADYPLRRPAQAAARRTSR